MCVPLRGGVTGYRSLGGCGDGLGGCDVQVMPERKWLSERDLNARVYAVHCTIRSLSGSAQAICVPEAKGLQSFNLLRYVRRIMHT